MTNIVRGQARSVCLVAAVSGALLFASAACREGGRERRGADEHGRGLEQLRAAANNGAARAATLRSSTPRSSASKSRPRRTPATPRRSRSWRAPTSAAATPTATPQRLREAMDDYRRALRNDPDNEEAQRNAAEIAPQVEGTPTGEYGEPAPLPISPNVADDEAKPTPTPKKP